MTTELMNLKTNFLHQNLEVKKIGSISVLRQSARSRKSVKRQRMVLEADEEVEE